ncbi:MAG: nucleoside-diphosphate kinase [Spirochaetota bacterium]
MPDTKTLVLIKPDGLSKSLTGNILTRFSETRLQIIGAKMVRVSRDLAERHYESHKNKPFYPELLDYIMGKLHKRHKVMALVYYGENAIEKIRAICGHTNPEKAEPESIRGQYGRILTSGLFENVVHASDSIESAEKEIKMWFEPHEIIYEIYPTEEKIFHNYKKLVWKA